MDKIKLEEKVAECVGRKAQAMKDFAQIVAITAEMQKHTENGKYIAIQEAEAEIASLQQKIVEVEKALQIKEVKM